MDFREVAAEDADQALSLYRDAFFGADPTTLVGDRGVRRWGVFEGKRLVAIASDRFLRSYIGGQPVSTAGVAAVAVSPEQRGRGHGNVLMSEFLRKARTRGAAVATLFPSAPAFYRRVGFEQVGELQWASLPVSALHGAKVPPVIELRRAATADAAAIKGLYRTRAAGESLWLDRGAPGQADPFPVVDPADGGCTVAVDSTGQAAGYVRWQRSGHGETGAVLARDLIASTAPALQALLAFLSGFEGSVHQVRIRTTGRDPVVWSLARRGWEISGAEPYLIRVVDFEAALKSRGWSPVLETGVSVNLVDQVCPWNEGAWRLQVSDGKPLVHRTGDIDIASPTLTTRGAGLFLAGGTTTAQLRRGGMLSGPADFDTRLDLLLAGPVPGVLDYF